MYKLKTNRGFWQTLLLTIVTLGFYQWYLVYAFAKETNIVCKEDGKKTPGLIVYVLLSIITSGIYAIVWNCMWIKRCNQYLKNNDRPEGLRMSTYLLIAFGWLIFGLMLYAFSDVSDTLVIIALCGWLIFSLMYLVILYKQLCLQNAVNSIYNDSLPATTIYDDTLSFPTNNLAESQCVKEQVCADNKIQPAISPTVKRYRIIATIFTSLLIFGSLKLVYGEWAPLAKILLFIPILFSLLKISANKATRNAVIIIFSTIIFEQLSFLFNFLPFRVGYWIFSYLPILYYISIAYAVSIILRNNRFEGDAVKRTWVALFPLLWICPQALSYLEESSVVFSVVLIPACFYAIQSSAFSGPSEEELLTARPYAAVNRYTIASVVVCILTYAIYSYFIVKNYIS